MGARRGDRLVFIVDPRHPDEGQFRLLRRSYAGVLAGVFGTPDDARAYLEEERSSWGDA